MLWLQQIGGFGPAAYATAYTRDLALGDATIDITGVNFQPSKTLCLANISGNAAVSVGFDMEGTCFSVFSNHNAAPNLWENSGYLGKIVTGIGAFVIFDTVVYKPNGISFSLAKTGSPTGTAVLNLLLLR